MAIDRNAVIKLHKNENIEIAKRLDMNRSMAAAGVGKSTSLIHKQRNLACKEPWPFSSGLLHLVNPEVKGLLLSPPNCGGS